MANFWDRTSAAWDALRGRSAKMDTLELFREIFGGNTSWAGKDVTLESAIRVATALACGRVISQGIAMLPWKVHRVAGRTHDLAVDHALYDVLAVSPNTLQTSFEFVETIALHMVFAGNAYIWIPRVSGRIDQMWPFEPRWVTVRCDFAGRPTYEVKSPDGKVRATLAADEVWHLRGPSWVGHSGLDFVKLAREALGLSMALEEGQARLLAQGSRTSGVLSVEGSMSDEQYKKLRAWLEKEHEGPANAGRTMIVDRAAKWIANSMSNVDAQTVEQRKFQIEEVCRFFGVMPIMVGYSDKAATYASAEQMFIAHAVHTLGPWMTRLEKSADKFLLTAADRKAGHYTKFNEKALLRTTAKEQMESLARGVLSSILTRNEAREVLDRDPIDGGDELLAPANTFLGDPPTAGGTSGGTQR